MFLFSVIFFSELDKIDVLFRLSSSPRIALLTAGYQGHLTVVVVVVVVVVVAVLEDLNSIAIVSNIWIQHVSTRGLFPCLYILI